MLGFGKCCTATPTPLNTPSTNTPTSAVSPHNPQTLDESGSLSKVIDGKAFINMGFKFLNVSGKIGTPLGIGEKCIG